MVVDNLWTMLGCYCKCFNFVNLMNYNVLVKINEANTFFSSQIRDKFGDQVLYNMLWEVTCSFRDECSFRDNYSWFESILQCVRV